MEIKNKKVRIAILVVMVAGLAVGLYLLLSGMGVLPSRAANVEYGLQVSNSELKEGETLVVNVSINANGNKLGYVKTEVNFDESKIQLSENPSVSNVFGRQIEVSTQNQANQNGSILFVLGADPAQRDNLPTGSIQLATLRFTSATSSLNQTVNISVNTQNSSVVSEEGNRLIQTGQTVSVVLNPDAEPTNAPTIKPTTTPTPTATAKPTPTPTSGPTPPPGVSQGLWISPEELAKLPTSGSAWENLLSAANSSWGTAHLDDNNSNHDVYTLAGALVAARTGDSAMHDKVVNALQSAMNSDISRALELSRGLQTYIIAADLIGYRTPQFESWVRDMINTPTGQYHSGGSELCNTYGQPLSPSGLGDVQITAYRSASNWGGHARASVAAAALYLNDEALLDRVTRAYRAFIGEAVTNNLYCTDTTWHADFTNKWGVNRKGAVIQGQDVSGVLPEDWRRAADFQWPPIRSGYMWEGMQGYVVTAVLLHRAGIVPFDSGENAVVRSMDILYRVGFTPGSDDAWIPWLVNYYAGTNFPTSSSIGFGKNMGWTNWTHQ